MRQRQSVTQRHLRFFGHIARSAPDEDYHRAVAATIHKPPSDWKRPPGRPNHTWLRATESDLGPLNMGPSYAWKKAASREHWRSIVDTATLKKNSMLWRREEKDCDMRYKLHGPESVCLSICLYLSICVRVCLSQVGVLSRRLDGSSLFLAYRLPSTYPVLQKNLDTLTKIIIPSSATLAVKVSPSRPTTRRYSQLLST